MPKILYLLFFILTLITTTLAGTEWMLGKYFLMPEHQLGLNEFWQGLHFSVPFLMVLTFHEFGHYFMAKHHQVKATLPLYIPFWVGIISGIGTLGAFIRVKDPIKSRLKYFDIGIAGPLAGFVVALILLIYGFTHLPPAEHIFTIHPEYKKWGLNYAQFAYKNNEGAALIFGDSILFNWLKDTFANTNLLPNPYEMAHYPYLLAGYLSLFFTALNLLPVGQLDGGHILYGLIGNRAFRVVSPVIFLSFLFYAGLGTYGIEDFLIAREGDFWNEVGYLLLYIYFNYLCCSKITENRTTNLLIALCVVLGQFGFVHYYPEIEGYEGFLAFSFVLGRFLGVYHPSTEENEVLDTKRKVLGWFAILIFVLCASAKPFIFG